MKSTEFINEILKAWASRIENGKPNPNDCYHVALLSQVLREMKLSNDFVGEFIGNLNTEQKNTCEINSVDSGIATEILDPLLKEESGSYDFRQMGGDALTGAFGGDGSAGATGAVGSESVVPPQYLSKLDLPAQKNKRKKNKTEEVKETVVDKKEEKEEEEDKNKSDKE